MTRPRPVRARLVPLLALALALSAASTACGQEPRPAQGGAAASGAAATRAPANPDSLLTAADRSRYKGEASAPVTIVEISDFQCPYCRQWAEQTYPRIDSAYIKTGKVRLIYVNYPLTTHHQAFPAAKAALCAGLQGQYWPMHDRLFRGQREWSGQGDPAQRFARYAVELQLDPAAYRDCYDNDRVAPVIINDVGGVMQANIQGTPNFILNGQRLLQGAVTYEEMAAAIDSLLAAPAAAPPAAPAPPRP